MIIAKRPIARVLKAAIAYAPVPVAKPMPNEKNTNAVSRVSFTGVRKRMIDSAPTRLKARAILFPITIITKAVIDDRSARVWTKETEYENPLWVHR
jgi:hypothetical protein